MKNVNMTSCLWWISHNFQCHRNQFSNATFEGCGPPNWDTSMVNILACKGDECVLISIEQVMRYFSNRQSIKLPLVLVNRIHTPGDHEWMAISPNFGWQTYNLQAWLKACLIQRSSCNGIKPDKQSPSTSSCHNPWVLTSHYFIITLVLSWHKMDPTHLQTHIHFELNDTQLHCAHRLRLWHQRNLSTDRQTDSQLMVKIWTQRKSKAHFRFFSSSFKPCHTFYFLLVNCSISGRETPPDWYDFSDKWIIRHSSRDSIAGYEWFSSLSACKSLSTQWTVSY